MLKKSWDKSDTKSISKKMIEKVRPDESLPKRISLAQRQFEIQIKKLDGISTKLQKIHDTLFQKVMIAQRHNKVSYARAYAQELVQVRNTLKMVNNGKLQLEQIKIRLDTVTEFGDVVVTLSPCMSIIQGLAPSISGIMPQANTSMSDLSQMLGDIISGSSMGQVSETELGGNNAEANAIIEEAHNIMVENTQSAFPDVPSSVTQQPVIDANRVNAGVMAQPQPQQQPQQQQRDAQLTPQVPVQQVQQPQHAQPQPQHTQLQQQVQPQQPQPHAQPQQPQQVQQPQPQVPQPQPQQTQKDHITTKPEIRLLEET